MSIRPGEVWNDTSGTPIQAHGGGILFDNGTYYWYGENKDAPNSPKEMGRLHRVDVRGVNCYSSTDLVNWKNEGVVLAPVNEPGHDLHPSQVVERPKVLKCPATGQYVMWMHIDSQDYRKANVGVAVSDKPTGPFAYQGSFRPCGQESRDMTLFQDEDGTAYLIHSSENNSTIHIAPLTEDYLLPEGDFIRAFIGDYREAPAVFKYQGRYYMLTSGCTGWRPNPARWHSASAMMGGWETGGDPCVEDSKETTFDSQPTFVLPLPPTAEGEPERYLFMADRWNPENLQDSRYVWLPMTMEAGAPRIEWQDEWELQVG
ncbi:MAG: glycoside hydrolase family 43 protein [Armatimonadaceae bacterium]